MHVVLLADMHQCKGAGYHAIMTSLERIASGLGESAERVLGIGYLWVLPEDASPEYAKVCSGRHKADKVHGDLGCLVTLMTAQLGAAGCARCCWPIWDAAIGGGRIWDGWF
jgi:hypothetical protein